MSRWPAVKLGHVLEPAQRPEVVDATREYRLLGVRLESCGPFLREIKTGAETSAKTLFRVRAGDFIYSRLFAWRGAFGVISPQLDGCYVSNEFPIFVPRDGRVDPQYLNYWFRLPAVLERIAADCTGSTPLTRNRYKEHFFLELEMPLPPIAEQRRVVRRIEQLAALATRTQWTAAKRDRASTAFVSASLARLFSAGEGWETATVGEISERPQYGYTGSANRSPIGPQMLRITDIQRGRVDWPSVPYCDCREPEAFLLRSGDIVFARTGATTGKSYLIDECPTAIFASYLIRLRPQHSVSAEYLYEFFQSPVYWTQIAASVRGTGQPNCNAAVLAQVRVPLPAEAQQREVVRQARRLREFSYAYDSKCARESKSVELVIPAALRRAFVS